MLQLFRIAFLVALLVGSWLAVTDAAPAAPGNHGDKVQHLLAFAALAFLLDQSLPPRLTSFWLPVALPLLAYGLLIEVVQYHLPHRSFDLLDLAADFAGLLCYWIVRPVLGRISFLPRPSVP